MATLTSSLPVTRHDWQMASIIARREIRDSFRDWRIVVPTVFLTLMFPSLMNFTADRILSLASRYNPEMIADRLFPFLLMVVGFFPASFSLVIALETFVGEKERKSLEPLLAAPLTNTQLYLGKMLAALCPPLLASYLGITVYTVGLWLTEDTVVPFGLFALVVLLTTVQAMVMVAGAVVASTQTTSVRAANLLASFIIIPMALLLQFEAAMMFIGNREGMWWILLALVIVLVVLVRMGVKMFNREELLGRELDQLQLGAMGRRFWHRFRGRDTGATTPLSWYRETFGLLKALRAPALILGGAFGLALVLGYYMTQRYGLPKELYNSLTGENRQQYLYNLQLLANQLPFTIFWHNVRALLLIAFLGIFSIGMADIVFFALPWVVLSLVALPIAAAGESPLVFILATVVPHGVVEIPALVLAAAGAIRWHTVVIAPPPERSLSESWVLAAADYFRIFIGLVIPLLFLAGLLEAYLTPQILLRVYGN
ncbi:MAG: stage II sporulation protein M [Chloroflexi bacterium]|nr:stage II sporulation protein M [Chloroflexota bacterium]MBP8056603.1 stage II sporulation protein M [Chloroflexota bacterium]